MGLNRTLSRALDILIIIAGKKEGCSLAELCELMEIPKTSCFDILKTLLHYGMVRYEEDTKRYFPGARPMLLGHSYQESMDIARDSKPYLADLSARLEKTTFLGALHGNQVIYLNKCDYDGDLNIKVNMGILKPLYCTGLGKAILAGLPTSEVLKLLKGISLEKFTQHTHANVNSLLADLERIKKRGYAMDEQELTLSILCLAAPVYGVDGKVIASISASGVLALWGDIDASGKVVAEVALKLSKQMGYRGDVLYP